MRASGMISSLVSLALITGTLAPGAFASDPRSQAALDALALETYGVAVSALELQAKAKEPTVKDWAKWSLRTYVEFWSTIPTVGPAIGYVSGLAGVGAALWSSGLPVDKWLIAYTNLFDVRPGLAMSGVLTVAAAGAASMVSYINNWGPFSVEERAETSVLKEPEQKVSLDQTLHDHVLAVARALAMTPNETTAYRAAITQTIRSQVRNAPVGMEASFNFSPFEILARQRIVSEAKLAAHLYLADQIARKAEAHADTSAPASHATSRSILKALNGIQSLTTEPALLKRIQSLKGRVQLLQALTSET